MDLFIRSRFGTFLQRHFADLFTKPSQQVFLLLAFGFVLSPTRHTVANYIWRAGAIAFRHFTRFYVFLGGPLYAQLDWLWISVIQLAERFVPEEQPLRVRFDETTCKKTGPRIEPAGYYRNGAGTARQEYRTLYGVNFVVGQLLIRLRPWPDEFVSLPIGLAVYLKETKARELGLPYRRRSELARAMLDRLCGTIAGHRRVVSVQDGGYATRYFLRGLPDKVDVVGRLQRNSPLYGLPTPKPPGRPGPQAKKGKPLGTALDFAKQEESDGSISQWRPHPSEPGAEVRLVQGIWHSVLPGVPVQVVLVRRKHLRHHDSKRQRQRWLEAFFTTALRLSLEEILQEYQGRWTIEILLHEARESYGLGRDRCRSYRKIVGINSFRLIIGAAEVLYFAHAVEEAEVMDLRGYRSWYRTKQGPSLFDIRWAVREHLYSEGIFPKVGFWETMAVFREGSSGGLPRAA